MLRTSPLESRLLYARGARLRGGALAPGGIGGAAPDVGCSATVGPSRWLLAATGEVRTSVSPWNAWAASGPTLGHEVPRVGPVDSPGRDSYRRCPASSLTSVSPWNAWAASGPTLGHEVPRVGPVDSPGRDGYRPCPAVSLPSVSPRNAWAASGPTLGHEVPRVGPVDSPGRDGLGRCPARRRRSSAVWSADQLRPLRSAGGEARDGGRAQRGHRFIKGTHNGKTASVRP